MASPLNYERLAGVPGFDCAGKEPTRTADPVTDYLKRHEELCNEARSLSARKNHDYADSNRSPDDPFCVFKNFMQVERLGICSVEQGFLTRLSDKFTRLANLLAPGHEQAVKDESVKDTVLDLCNYSLLLQVYLELKAKSARGRQ